MKTEMIERISYNLFKKYNKKLLTKHELSHELAYNIAYIDALIAGKLLKTKTINNNILITIKSISKYIATIMPYDLRTNWSKTFHMQPIIEYLEKKYPNFLVTRCEMNDDHFTVNFSMAPREMLFGKDGSIDYEQFELEKDYFVSLDGTGSEFCHRSFKKTNTRWYERHEAL